MAIKNHTCISLICDADNQVFDGGSETHLHFDSIDDGRSHAEEYEWFVADDGRALCGHDNAAHLAKARKWVESVSLSADELERLIEVYPQLDPEEEGEDEPAAGPAQPGDSTRQEEA